MIMTNEMMKFHGSMVAVLEKGDGSVEVTRKDNLILNVGYDFICDAIGNNASRPAVMQQIAIGTNSTAVVATHTALQSELLRKASTYAHTAGTKIMTFTTTFNPTEATGAIVEAGVVNASSAGIFLDRVTFSVINKGIDDTLTVTFQFTLS